MNRHFFRFLDIPSATLAEIPIVHILKQDFFYGDEKKLAFDLADALNFEIRALAQAGCKYIQVDEPLFARKVEQALEYGVECLDRCFDGLPDDVVRVSRIPDGVGSPQ